MYKLCKTEQSAARQRQLEQGLLQAMVVQQYEDISISDLCDRLGVPRKSFYRYFSSKDGALAALLDHTLMEFEHSLPASGKFRPGTAIGDLERFFVFWHERKMLLDALERSHLSGMLVERATSHVLREKLVPRYLLGLPQNVQGLAMTFCVCGLLSMVVQWHHGGYRESPKEMARIATIMLSQPLVPGARE